jgi:MFS family permease
MGVLLSAFLWPYAFSLLFAGGLVDRLKRRRVLTISMIASGPSLRAWQASWSAMCNS